MAAGINEDRINALKVELLTYIESLNVLSNRVDNCRITVQSNMEGEGKRAIISKIDSISEKMPKYVKLINSYINLLSGVVTSYDNQDKNLSSQVTGHIDRLG